MDSLKRSRTELVAALEAGGYDDLRTIGEVKLQAVMGKPEVTMFEMSGLVGKHLS